jgi:flotillin
MRMSGSNQYLDDVIQQQANVQMELRKAAPPMSMSRARMAAGGGGGPAGGGRSGGNGVDVRISGFLRWKTVLVPPNAWVVHTRRGQAEPLHLGLGVSFRFDPTRDSYLVAPATMQTLAINARCICAERQGILVQAYVQWVIDDFRAAYRTLDFSDTDDPMRIVNVQLREQAEASIKDKVATLSIDEVLADRRPIIEELTARLRSVAEGQGLKIVQVQIKEAVVSSTTVWEAIQKPFREETIRLARMAELDRERAVHQREVEDRNAAERARISADAETERLRRAQEVELATSRAKLEEARVHAELAQIEAQRRLDAARAEADLATLAHTLERAKRTHDATVARDQKTLDLDAARRRVEADVSPGHLDELLVRALPELVRHLPRPERSEVIHIGDGAPEGVAALAGLVRGLRAVLKGGESPGR